MKIVPCLPEEVSNHRLPDLTGYIGYDQVEVTMVYVVVGQAAVDIRDIKIIQCGILPGVRDRQGIPIDQVDYTFRIQLFKNQAQRPVTAAEIENGIRRGQIILDNTAQQQTGTSIQVMTAEKRLGSPEAEAMPGNPCSDRLM